MTMPRFEVSRDLSLRTHNAPVHVGSAPVRNTLTKPAYSLRQIGAGSGRSTVQSGAFTLLELMVVIGIMLIVAALLAPAVNTMRTAGDITAAADTITGALQQGRAHAMANNTYVWVGLYEENAGASTPTSSTPPYPGRGRVVIGTVASVDGTKIFDDGDPSAGLPANRIRQVGKLITIEGIHLTDIGAPSGGDPNKLDGRPDLPYTDGQGLSADHFNRISSESADSTRFPFTTQAYTFHKTVRFNPRGEANLNSTYSLKRVAEIGVRPTNGTTVNTATPNVAAIQFSGIAGNFKVYRK